MEAIGFIKIYIALRSKATLLITSSLLPLTSKKAPEPLPQRFFLFS
jgi:hypothetical protein